MLYQWYMYSFFAHLGKSSIGKFLRKCFYNGILVIEKDSGARFRLEIEDYLTFEILKHGSYEPQSLLKANAIMKDSDGVFMDVGSNFGLYTCYLLKKNQNKGIAIDASYKAFGLLLRNLALNGLNNRVTKVNAALSVKDELLHFSPFKSDNLGSSRIVNDDSDSNAFLVNSTTLSKIVANIDPPKIRLIKIDVEGHEEMVLSGFDFNSKYRPDYILLEYELENNPEVHRIKVKLNNEGYEAFDINDQLYQEGVVLPESNLLFKSIQINS
jgi:FkbM family methyltransferase